jgi:hypothetical protein
MQSQCKEAKKRHITPAQKDLNRAAETTQCTHLVNLLARMTGIRLICMAARVEILNFGICFILMLNRSREKSL